MNKCNDVIILIGRLILGGFFVWGAVNFIINFESTVGFVGSVFPIPLLFTIGAIALKGLGGLSIIFGYKMKWGAIALAFFVLVATFAYHNMFINPAETISFTKNSLLFGALLIIITAHPGRFAINK